MKMTRFISILALILFITGVFSINAAVKKDLKPLVVCLSELSGNRQIQIEFDTYYLTPENMDVKKGFMISSFNSSFHKQTNFESGIYENWTAYFLHKLSGKIYSQGTIKTKVIIKENAVTILPFKVGFEIIGTSETSANIKVNRIYQMLNEQDIMDVINKLKKDFAAKKYPTVYLGDIDITNQVFDK